MTDGADQPNLPALGGGEREKKKRGRPKGAKGKAPGLIARAQADLLKYSDAKYGTTIGQVMTDIVMPTKKELAQGKKWMVAKGLDWKQFTANEIVWRLKVWKLEELYGWSSKDAAAYLYKLASDLLPTQNQKQSPVEAPEDPNADYAQIDGIPVDETFLKNIPENQQLDLDIEDMLTP